MSQQTIDIGTVANDGTGDPARTAFDKVNDNFDEIYDEVGLVVRGLVADSSGSATANTNLIIAACDVIEAADGGVLIIPPGTYYVGKQDFAGTTGLGYSYQGYNIIEIASCTKPLKIILAGVKLIMAPSLKFGSFNPTTGVSSASSDADFKAFLGQFLEINSNYQVEIVGPFELDGNINSMTIGALFAGSYQLQAHGVRLLTNLSAVCREGYVHHCGTDGAYTSSAYTTSADPRKGVRLEKCKFEYNGRQGWSIVGGSNHTAVQCEFSYTGKNGVVSSSPGAGIDIEDQEDGVRDVLIDDCFIFDNTGVGIVSASGDSKRIIVRDSTVVGTTSWALWADMPGWRVENCVILGPCVNFYEAFSTEFDDGFKAFHTTFSCNAADGPTGILYTSRGDINPTYGYFDNCIFKADTLNGSPTWTDVADNFTPTANDGLPVFHNCSWDLLGSNQSHRMSGHFTGTNRFNHDGSSDLRHRNGSDGLPCYINSGILIINGTKYGAGQVVALTANTSISLMQSGTTFTNEGATALRTHTLGGAMAGHVFTFYVQDADGIKISAGTGDTIRMGASVSAAAGFISSTTIGDHVTIRAINLTEWVATAYSGTWTVT